MYYAVGYGIYFIDAQSTVTMLYCRSSQLPEQRLEARRRPPRASLFLISAPTNARGERHIHCDLQQYSLRSCKSLGRKMGLDTGMQSQHAVAGSTTATKLFVWSEDEDRRQEWRDTGTETQSTRPDLRYKYSFRSSFATYSTSADLQVPKNIANPVIIFFFVE